MRFEEINSLVTLIREKKPLILNITNVVTMDFIANGLLSFGASPVMSQAEQEMEELISLAGAVVINTGTLNDKFMDFCEVTALTANRLNKPIILDPVGAGASHYRTDANLKMIRDHKVSIIRGNASEILALSGERGKTKGVDSTTESDAAIENAKLVSTLFSSCVLMSGKTDVVVEGDEVGLFQRGSAMMPLITGSGCLFTAIVGAFRAVEKNCFKAAAAAAIFYGVCGERAAEGADGPGSFKMAFIDALHNTRVLK